MLLPSHAVCEWKVLNEEIDEYDDAYEHEYGDDDDGGGKDDDDNDR